MRVLCAVFSSSSRGKEKNKKKKKKKKKKWGGKRRGCLSGYNLNISERFTDKY
jgi:hypothetical protein